MQAIGQEFEQNYQTLVSVLQQEVANHQNACSATNAPTMMDSSLCWGLNKSTASFDSKNHGQHELRRALRRLDKSVEQMYNFWFPKPTQFSDIDFAVLQRISPLLIDLVTLPILQQQDTSTTTTNTDNTWVVRQDSIHVYHQLCVQALRLLKHVAGDISDQQLDLLLDLAANKLSSEPAPSYSNLLVTLLQTIHERLKNVPTMSLLCIQDTIELVSFLKTKCTQDCSSSDNTTGNGRLPLFDEGCHSMHCLLLHLLHHLATTCSSTGTNSVSQQLTEQYGVSLQLFADLKHLTLELVEKILDLLDEEDVQATEKNSSTIVVIHLVQILTHHFAIPHQAFCKPLRLLLISMTRQPATSNSIVPLLHVTEMVLSQQQTEQMNNDDKALQQAAGTVLYQCRAADIIPPPVLLQYVSAPWIQSSFMTSIALDNTIPPQDLLTAMLQQDGGGDSNSNSSNKASPWNVWIAHQLKGGNIQDEGVQSFVVLHAP